MGQHSVAQLCQGVYFASQEALLSCRDDFVLAFCFHFGVFREQCESPQGAATTTTTAAAAAAANLSTWLSNLNLGTFEDSLVKIGVESMGDLR